MERGKQLWTGPIYGNEGRGPPHSSLYMKLQMERRGRSTRAQFSLTRAFPGQRIASGVAIGVFRAGDRREKGQRGEKRNERHRDAQGRRQTVEVGERQSPKSNSARGGGASASDPLHSDVGGGALLSPAGDFLLPAFSAWPLPAAAAEDVCGPRAVLRRELPSHSDLVLPLKSRLSHGSPVHLPGFDWIRLTLAPLDFSGRLHCSIGPCTLIIIFEQRVG
ncbi:hypothetical protein CC78DRAFT_586079 [Lojkania enalia]|uniref:Uncharacterized protein n=1 Tax=Lojkania enalia TaxID=147567 RepID=A0A9P4N5E7_9PLEO|nr:hypothetical protein CC78DRAFT_586079 [Didymosphaeria enalia]